MFENISYYTIFGKTVLFYTGVLALLFILATAAIPTIGKKLGVPFAWHPKVARVAVTLAVIHGILALAVYL